MILYFSGTGNSKYCAEVLGSKLDDTVHDICKYPSDKIIIKDNQSLGFVFPIYAWGIPPFLENYINKIPEYIVREISDKNIPIWMVATCGDDTGMADKMFSKSLSRRGLNVRGIWSVIMPNIYVLLPGFDVDPDEVRVKKLNQVYISLTEIAKKISNGLWERNIHTGSFPSLKTGLVYPLFKKWGIFTKKWKSTDDCTGCGLCADSCPIGNIEMINNRPVWDNNCLSCVNCYHICPHNAIQYGNVTKGKGQYLRKLRPIFSRK